MCRPALVWEHRPRIVGAGFQYWAGFPRPLIDLASAQPYHHHSRVAPLMIGQIISHYRILEKLTGGRTEFVYEAEGTTPHRFMVLKFLPEDAAQDHAALDRFREAKSTWTLDHPDICTNADVSMLKQARPEYAKLQ